LRGAYNVGLCGWLAALVMPFFVPIDGLLLLAGVYGFLFVGNLLINTRFLLQKDAHLPKKNRCMVITGLALFALCDVNVLLYNLPDYFPGMEDVMLPFYTFIWVFYLPAQGLLALSGIKWYKKSESL
jgi:hypothetical protein